MRVWAMGLALVLALGAGAEAATAAANLDAVMARLDNLERENAILRARVEQLEVGARAEREAAPETSVAAIAPATAALGYAGGADLALPAAAAENDGGFGGFYAGLYGQVRAAEMFYESASWEYDQDIDGSIGGFVGANHVSGSLLVGIEARGFAGLGTANWKADETPYDFGQTDLGDIELRRSLRRTGGLDIAARFGAIVTDDLLLFGKAGAGVDFAQALYKCAGDGDRGYAIYTCPTKEEASATLPYITIGFGAEKNFGRFFTRGEAELQAYLSSWDSVGAITSMPESAFVPSASMAAGVRF